MSAVSFGLIGYGLWGQHHANAIVNSPDAELTAICARSEESRAKAKAAHPTAEIFADYREMIAREDITAIDVVVPSDLHLEFGTAALEAGKHVMMEKPMTICTATSQQLVATAKKADRLLGVGFELRLSELWGKAKQLIDDGRIGRPQYCLIELWRRPYRPGSQGWRFDINRVGNWVLEEPIHFFDLARWYMSSLGEPTSVSAFANSHQEGHPELQDNFSSVVRFPENGYAVVTQTLSAFQHHQTAKIAGTEGAIWASWSGAKDRDLSPTASLRIGLDDNVEDVPLNKPTGELFELQEEIDMFAQAVQGKRTLAAGGDEGIWSVAMCEFAQQSIDQGREIAFDNPLNH